MAKQRRVEDSPMQDAEDRVARVVREAVEEALREMEHVVTRYFAEGREDRLRVQQIVQMSDALERIAGEYGVEIAKPSGDLARLMTEARAKGAKESLGVEAGKEWLAANKDALDIALHNDRVKIKGILDESRTRINEIITSARLSGKSRADTVAEIQERMTDVGKITKQRAETIYRGELFSGYRQFAVQAAEDDGIEYFQFINVIDSRTEPICLEHVGEIKTREEWENIEPLAMQYGLHYGCRGRMIGVKNPDAQRHKDREELYQERAKRQIEKRGE